MHFDCFHNQHTQPHVCGLEVCTPSCCRVPSFLSSSSLFQQLHTHPPTNSTNMKKFIRKLFSKDKIDSDDSHSPSHKRRSASSPPSTSVQQPTSSAPPKPTVARRFESTFDELYFVGKQLGIGSFGEIFGDLWTDKSPATELSLVFTATVKECTRKEDSQKFAVKIIDKAQLRGMQDKA